MQMMANLTLLEHTFQHQIKTALIKIFAVLKKEHLGQNEIDIMKKLQHQYEDLQKYKVSILLQQMSDYPPLAVQLSPEDKARMIEI